MGVPNTQPSLTTQTLAVAASLSMPSRNITVSMAPTSALICRENTAPNKLVLLICAFSQRKSSAVTQATPVARSAAGTGFIRLVMTNTVGAKPVVMTWSRSATPRVTWM